MTEILSADTPLAVDRVDRARGENEGVALHMTGRWLRHAGADQGEPLLVVQVQGRRHRFAPVGGGDGAAAHGSTSGNGRWEATFNVPSWAEPSREGQAALWVGTAVVPVPLPGTAPALGAALAPEAASPRGAAPAPEAAPPRGAASPPTAPAPPHEPHRRPPPPPALGEARAWPPPPAAPAAPGLGAGLRPGEVPDTIVDTGRTGPLAELLFKESVSALHAELEQRSTDVARLQGSLADTQSELEARTAMQAALESAHGDLRGELQDLMSAVNVQREDFEKRLAGAEDRRAAAEAERDRLREELAALTAEVGDLRARLAATQAGQQQHGAELVALRDQLAAAQVSRDAAVGEAAGLRAELERLGSELAVTREHQAAQGGDLGEAQRLLAEARSLSEQLRSQSSH